MEMLGLETHLQAVALCQQQRRWRFGNYSSDSGIDGHHIGVTTRLMGVDLAIQKQGSLRRVDQYPLRTDTDHQGSARIPALQGIQYLVTGSEASHQVRGGQEMAKRQFSANCTRDCPNSSPP